MLDLALLNNKLRRMIMKNENFNLVRDTNLGQNIVYIPESHSLRLSPAVPFDPMVQRYGNFSYYGAYDYPESDWVSESMSWRETAYIGDWTSLSEIIIKGRDVYDAMSWIFPCSFKKFEIGRGKHALLCFENGHVSQQGILFRHAEDEFEYQYGGIHRRPMEMMEEICKGKNFDVNFEYTGTSKFKFQVQGPNSLYILEKACNESLRDIRFLHFRYSIIADCKVLIIRQGMSGDLGYEIQGPIELGQQVYKAILEAGKEFGIHRLGERVRMLNHTLAGLMHEMCRQDYTPFESGDMHAVVFDHDFFCREVLEKAYKERKIGWTVLVWDREDVIDIYSSYFRGENDAYRYIELPCHGGLMFPNVPGVQNKVLKDGNNVGICFSPKYDYQTRQLISNSIINLTCHEPGTKVTIVWGDEGQRQKMVTATVMPAPYFKSPRRYMDVTTLPLYL